MRVLKAERIASAAQADQFPAPSLPEVAFLGRSNVGKSSLINRLVARRRLALTSSTPGKTRLLHWYYVERPGRELLFVDLPGYGYAKVSKEERKRWKRFIESYLAARSTLRVAVLLQDLRRDFSDDESGLIAWLAERDVPVIVALTKTDKLKPMRRAARVRVLRKSIGAAPASVLVTSGQTGDGVPELWREIDALILGSKP
jgi:GTP-binding protein